MTRGAPLPKPLPKQRPKDVKAKIFKECEMINVNCIYNDRRVWCKNKQIARGLLGLGARMCKERDNTAETCEVRCSHPKPMAPPPPPLQKRYCKGFHNG